MVLVVVEETIGNGERVFVTTALELTESLSPVVSHFLVRPFLLRTCIDTPHGSGVDILVPFFPTDSVVCDTRVFFLVTVLCSGLDIAPVGAEMTNDGKVRGVHLTPISYTCFAVLYETAVIESVLDGSEVELYVFCCCLCGLVVTVCPVSLLLEVVVILRLGGGLGCTCRTECVL